MEKISASTHGVKHRAKKVFSCQRVGGLSKISPPISNPSPSISVTENLSSPGTRPLTRFRTESDEHGCLVVIPFTPFVCQNLEVNKQTSNDEINDLEDFQDFLHDQDAPIIDHIETPLFGSISVMENPFAENHCLFCGKALPARAPGTKGRPQSSHPECGQLSRSLDFFANSLERMTITPAAVRRLRSRLFQISNGLQLPRDSNGRFVRQGGGR